MQLVSLKPTLKPHKFQLSKIPHHNFPPSQLRILRSASCNLPSSQIHISRTFPSSFPNSLNSCSLSSTNKFCCKVGSYEHWPDDYIPKQDWPSRGIIADPPDQGDIPICWALVIAAAAAAYHVLCYGGKLPKPSVQELLDVTEWDPIKGAVFIHPLAYAIFAGLSDESYYPFEMSPHKYTFDGFVLVPLREECLIDALEYGPLIGLLELEEGRCHVILITGWGYLEDRIAFQFRNSYGTEWHYAGYDYLQKLEGSEDGVFYVALEGSKGFYHYQAPLISAAFILKNGRGVEELKQKWQSEWEPFPPKLKN